MHTGKDGKVVLILNNNTIASEKREVTEKEFDRNIFFQKLKRGWNVALSVEAENIYFWIFVLFCFCLPYVEKKKHCTKNLLFILTYTALFCRCWIVMKVKLIYCFLSLLKVLWLKSQHWSKNPLIKKNNSKGNWEYIIVYTYYLGFSVKDCMK